MRIPVCIRGWIVLTLMLGAGDLVLAVNGDIQYVAAHCAASALSSATDTTYDLSDDTLWVADLGSGTVCHYNLAAFGVEIELIGSIPHPLGAAPPIPPFSPLVRGIAYDSDADNLVLLAQQTVAMTTTFVLQRMDKTGVAIGGTITLSPPDSNAFASGLSYDNQSMTLWYRDLQNNKLIQANPATGATLSQITLPGDVIFGSGIACVLDQGSTALEVTYGDIIDFRPNRVRRFDLAGNPTGVEVDLSQIPDSPLGVVRPPAGTVTYVTTDDLVYKIDATVPNPLPPSSLSCTSQVNGNLELNWTNHGPYTSILVIRDGQQIASLSPSATTYTDTDPQPFNGEITYDVVVFGGGGNSSAQCTIQTGAGGFLDYVPFAGGAPWGVAVNGTTLYVTDSTTNNTIYVYDTDLNFTGTTITLSTPLLSNIQGIAYNPNTNQLIVSRRNHWSLTFLDATTGQFQTSLLTVSGIEIGGISYYPLLDAYVFLDLTNMRVRAVDADSLDGTPDTVGVPLFDCAPPGVSGLILARGICVLEPDGLSPDGYLLATVQDTGNIADTAELFFPQNCFPRDYPVTLQEMGASSQEPEGVRGVDDRENTLFVANGTAGAIFRILLAAGGEPFLRGDANSDGLVDLADALYIANYLFTQGPDVICGDSGDANDDGIIDISDSLYLIFFEFLGGAAPPEPYPTPGPDPTFLDETGC